MSAAERGRKVVMYDLNEVTDWWRKITGLSPEAEARIDARRQAHEREVFGHDSSPRDISKLDPSAFMAQVEATGADFFDAMSKMRGPLLDEKGWATLRARAALRGILLYRSNPTDGGVLVFAVADGKVRVIGIDELEAL